MAGASISTERREDLTQLRNLLLNLHKLLMDRERAAWEAEHGPVAGPSALLQLLLEEPQFAWLRKFSSLVVEIDELLAPRSKGDEAMAEALMATARGLVSGASFDETFAARYREAVVASPEIELRHTVLSEILDR